MTFKDAALGLLLVTTVIGAVTAARAKRDIERIKAESDSITAVRDSAYKALQSESKRTDDSLRTLAGKSTTAVHIADRADVSAALLRRKLTAAETAADSLPLAIALVDTLQLANDSLRSAHRTDSLRLVILGQDRDKWKWQADSLHGAMIRLNSNVGAIANIRKRSINLGFMRIPVKETLIAGAGLTLGYGLAKASD